MFSELAQAACDTETATALPGISKYIPVGLENICSLLMLNEFLIMEAYFIHINKISIISPIVSCIICIRDNSSGRFFWYNATASTFTKIISPFVLNSEERAPSWQTEV